MSETELQPGEEAPEAPAAGSESAPEQLDGENKPAEGDGKDPAGFTKAINRKHYQLMEKTREADALAEENARLKAAVPGVQRPEVPELPSPYDENYATLIAEREQAVKAQAEYDARATVASERQSEDQADAAKKEQEVLTKAVGTYTERATKLSISETELAAAAITIDAYGMHNNLVEHVLADEQGPLITMYLAANPAELEKLQGMTLLDAAVHVSTDIKTKAIAARPAVGDTPPPPDGLSGGGVPPAQYGPKGATYE